MNTILSTFAGWGALFILTTLSGVWLSHLGKPFNTFIFTAHKLLAVGTIFIVARHIFRLQKMAEIRHLADSSALLLTGLLLATLVVSGALLSIGKGLPAAVLFLHQVTPGLALLSAGLAVYLLAGVSVR